MATIEDRMNNAMERITYWAKRAHAERRLSKGRLDSVLKMSNHWGAFWNSKERALIPTLALKPKLDRYAKWYTKAWSLMPSQDGGKLMSPEEIDPSYLNMADAAWNDYRSTINRVRQHGQQTSEVIKSTATIGTVGILLGAFAAWYFFMRGNRS